MRPAPTSSHHPLATFAIVAASSILFCSKGVVAKLAYAHGVDAITVLALRMGFALPFFVAMAAWASRGADRLDVRDWARLAGLGFIGYYVSSLVNFTGLQFVSVGLERIILYTYPSIVLGISAFVLRRRVRPAVWGACVLAWLGIVTAFVGETQGPATGRHVALGSALIFASALTYAGFILLSGDTVRRVGSLRFTGLAAGFSCVFILMHAGFMRPASLWLHLPSVVYGEGLVLAVFGTVAPALLLAMGLRRTSPQRFAIIGMIGPVTTLFLAWLVLGERPNFVQGFGFALTLAGGLAVSLLKAEVPSPRTSRA